MKIIQQIVAYILKIMYIFPINNKKIFILSFGGKSTYGFDGRALIEYSNRQNLGYKFIWAVENKNNDIKKIPNVENVKLKSIKGIYQAMTSGVFITNINPNINPMSYVPFRKNQILINTWHGYPLKTLGKYDPTYDLKQINTSTCFISHSKQNF